jgi:hypothetical protein
MSPKSIIEQPTLRSQSEKLVRQVKQLELQLEELETSRGEEAVSVPLPFDAPTEREPKQPSQHRFHDNLAATESSTSWAIRTIQSVKTLGRPPPKQSPAKTDEAAMRERRSTLTSLSF